MSLCGIGFTLPELVYGRIEEDDLREVWYRSPGLVRLRAQVPSQLQGVCGQCLHRDMCQGECVANNYQLSAALNAPYYFCQSANEQGLFPGSRRKPGHGPQSKEHDDGREKSGSIV